MAAGGRPPRVALILRDPIARLESNYWFMTTKYQVGCGGEGGGRGCNLAARRVRPPLPRDPAAHLGSVFWFFEGSLLGWVYNLGAVSIL